MLIGPGAECSSVVWLSDGEVTCVPVGDFVVGTYDVTLRVANDTSLVAGSLRTECPALFYGSPGDPCQRCPVRVCNDT